ncbi:unnamed protein product, partial [Cyprideis torosa]
MLAPISPNIYLSILVNSLLTGNHISYWELRDGIDNYKEYSLLRAETAKNTSLSSSTEPTATQRTLGIHETASPTSTAPSLTTKEYVYT